MTNDVLAAGPSACYFRVYTILNDVENERRKFRTKRENRSVKHWKIGAAVFAHLIYEKSKTYYTVALP